MAIDTTNSPILETICQAGISDTPNRNIVWVGAVIGNMDRITQMGLSGKLMNAPNVQRGIYPAMTYNMERLCPSAAVDTTPPIVTASIEKSK